MNKDFIRLLLVESNYDDALLIQNQLCVEEQINFDLVHVYCLEKAITYLEEEFFDLILLEPILSGTLRIFPLSALLILKTTFPSIPIVVLTRLNDEELIFRGLEMGADHYILKKDLPSKILSCFILDAIQINYKTLKSF